jgi:hypothetical protein
VHVKKRGQKGSKGTAKGPRRTRRKIAASCAAAGAVFVLEAACNEPVAMAIMPPTDARSEARGRDAASPTEAGADAKQDGPPVYYIMPPQEAGPKPDTAAKKDATIYYILPPPKKDAAVTKKDGPPIYYILPPKKDQ